jgi:septal ring factor EnvC (AmiA/AmiB activator)
MYPSNGTSNCLHILLFLLFFVQTPAFASDRDDFEHYQKNLEKVQKSIEKVKNHLKSTRYKRGHVVTELQQLESKISENSVELDKTEANIDRLDDKISDLRKELGQLQRKLNTQRQSLSEQIRAAYAIGRQQQVKMLLNQQDPAEMGRVIVYFDYLNRAREQHISDFLDSISEKQRVEDELSAARKEYEESLATRAWSWKSATRRKTCPSWRKVETGSKIC